MPKITSIDCIVLDWKSEESVAGCPVYSAKRLRKTKLIGSKRRPKFLTFQKMHRLYSSSELQSGIQAYLVFPKLPLEKMRLNRKNN